MKEIIDQSNMKQIIQVPTHRAGYTLDWIIIPNFHPEVITDHIVHVTSLSDHCTIVFQVNTTKSPKVIQSIKSRNIKNINLDAFRHDVAKSLANLPNVNIKSYDAVLKNVLDTHAPLMIRLVTQRPYSPWLTTDVKEAKRQMRKAEKKWRRTLKTTDRDTESCVEKINQRLKGTVLSANF